MKKFSKISTVLTSGLLMLGLFAPSAALAASAPALGDAATFSVLGAAAMSSANTTTLSGDLGLSPGLAVSRTGTWVVGGTEYFGTGGLSATAQTAALGAYNNLVAQTTTGAWGTNPWSPAPGVWTDSSSPIFTGTITLNGDYNDVWVFKISTDFTFTGNVVLAGNAQACNVFWSVAGDATINSNSAFVGTLIAQNDITFAGNSTVNGRLISLSGTTIAMNGANSTISGPTCTPAPASASASSRAAATINVVKTVVNDNGGVKTLADFPLFVNGMLVFSGVTNTFMAPGPLFTVSETTSTNYTRTFSGDCDVNGQLNLNPGENKFCIVTNNDIGAPAIVPPVPPLIDVVKVPSPLALPSGPGPVTYTYTLRNIGTVPATNVTMVGDTCSPIVLVSGDMNADAKLDINETWAYRCTTTLSQTHTNTVVATGWANGISAVDIASATVVVGVPGLPETGVVPPLIHVTKVPSPLALFAGGGMVMYTAVISNPGIVPLQNVSISDDKCGQLYGPFGDANGNTMLDPNESWAYACQSYLNQTTTNTVVATGEANGFRVRDFAVVTVVVATAAPGLPNTGIAPDAVTGLFAALLLLGALLLVMERKRLA